MVAHAEGGKGELRPALVQLDAEDHSEFPVGVGEADLHAVGEAGPFWTLVFAGEKMGHRDAVLLEVASGGERDLSTRIARSIQVFGEGGDIEQRRRAACSRVVQRLPLAVGGSHRAVLGFEVGQSPRFGAEALADGLKRRVGNESERPVGALLGDDVLAGPIAAEPDVGMQLHANNVGRRRGAWREVRSDGRRSVIST
jgi:hypothetical protein